MSTHLCRGHVRLGGKLQLKLTHSSSQARSRNNHCTCIKNYKHYYHTHSKVFPIIQTHIRHKLVRNWTIFSLSGSDCAQATKHWEIRFFLLVSKHIICTALRNQAFLFASKWIMTQPPCGRTHSQGCVCFTLQVLCYNAGTKTNVIRHLQH